MNNVEKDCNSHRVSRIDQLFKLVRCTIATTSSKEIGDLVSKRAIVCVLLDSHKLDSVIAKVFNSRQHILGKLLVASNFGLW